MFLDKFFKKELSSKSKDLYNCFKKGVVVGGKETKEIRQLLKRNLIVKIKEGEDKGKFQLNFDNLGKLDEIE